MCVCVYVYMFLCVYVCICNIVARFSAILKLGLKRIVLFAIRIVGMLNERIFE